MHRLRWLTRSLRSPRSVSLGIVVAVLLFVAAVVVVPPLMVTYDGVTGDTRAQAVASARQSLLLLGGGLLAGLTLLFTWRRDTLNRDANFTDRYTEAVAQLGNDSVAVRLGGVYALERIARDSTRDRGTILDVLAAYIRHNSPADPEKFELALAVDLAAAALVVGRITLMSAPLNIVDLSGVHLAGADFFGANLSYADFSDSNLSGAVFSGADLSGALLFDVDLTGADLSDANLNGADLSGANVAGADLSNALVRNAVLRNASLSHANLDGADLSGAQTKGMDLSNAHLEGAILPTTPPVPRTGDSAQQAPPS